MPDLPPPVSRYLWLHRLGRAMLTFGLAVWTGLVGVSAYQYLVDPLSYDTPIPLRLGLVALFLAGPLWLLGRRLIRRWRPTPASRPASIALAASFALFLVWMTHDAATWRYPDRDPALRNDFPRAAESAALTLRYSPSHPGSLHGTLPKLQVVGFPPAEPGPENDAKWTAFLAKNGPAVEADWTELAPARAWIDELAACPEIGDQTETFDSPVLGFQALRQVSQAACARALQLAAADRRDEAVDTLLPILLTAQKLEPHARTLVRRMIANVLRRQTQNTLARVLADGDLPAATRARLALALAPRPDAAAGARLLIRCEYEGFSRLLFSMDSKLAARAFAEETGRGAEFWVRCAAAPFLRICYNPRLTANLAGDHMQAAGDAAARRDLARFAAINKNWLESPASALPGKNYAGRLMFLMATPSYENVVASYWKAEDERAALLARVEALP